MDASYAERWANYLVRKPLGPVIPAVLIFCGGPLFVVGVFTAHTSSNGLNHPLVMGGISVISALVWWERLGFQRALRRRDREIDDLRRDLARFTAPAPPKEKFGIPYAVTVPRPL